MIDMNLLIWLSVSIVIAVPVLLGSVYIFLRIRARRLKKSGKPLADAEKENAVAVGDVSVAVEVDQQQEPLMAEVREAEVVQPSYTHPLLISRIDFTRHQSNDSLPTERSVLSHFDLAEVKPTESPARKLKTRDTIRSTMATPLTFMQQEQGQQEEESCVTVYYEANGLQQELKPEKSVLQGQDEHSCNTVYFDAVSVAPF